MYSARRHFTAATQALITSCSNTNRDIQLGAKLSSPRCHSPSVSRRLIHRENANILSGEQPTTQLYIDAVVTVSF